MDFAKRDECWRKLESDEFDLLIIGGGINGAGVARDAAMRGMKVALVEASDLASGTSSRSSKLIHGGIRYLENLEFGLVFEALSERRHLFSLAPHLVHPLRFTVPLYRGGRVGMFKMGLGMWLYDALALFETPEPHERLSVDETMRRLPFLQDQGLLGAYAYSDAYMDDDRLVLETLRSAERAGATILSFAKAQDAEFLAGQVRRVRVVDQRGNKTAIVKAKHFVSTVGAWTDLLAPRLVGQWQRQLRPSKGVHLTFDRRRFALTDAVVMGAEERIVFAIPRHEMVIVGTTDTDFSGDPSEVCTSKEDVDYLLRVARDYFPRAGLTKEDILASYAGVRPLVDDSAATESKTSREHTILNDNRNVTFVMGGKYTTYRLIAEQVVNSILSYFTVEEQSRWLRSRTLEPLQPLITLENYSQAGRTAEIIKKDFGWSEEESQLLAGRHGAEALAILNRCPADVATGPSRVWRAEAWHAIHETLCGSVADFFLRRVPLFLSRADHGDFLYDDVVEVFQKELGFSDQEMRAQLDQLERHRRRELGWQNP